MHVYCFSSRSLNVTSADLRDAHSVIERAQSLCPEIKVDASNSVACTRAIRSFNRRGRGKSSASMYCVGSSKKIMPFFRLKVVPFVLLKRNKSFKFQLIFFFSWFHERIPHTCITHLCIVESFLYSVFSKLHDFYP